MNKNIILCGVGGQGTVLASKLIAAAAMEKEMQVMGAETIGMAQKGGSVFSHVRIGEDLHAPMIEMGTADLMIAFEPAEAVRMLPYLKQNGTVVVNSHPIMPVNAVLGGGHYDAGQMLDYLRQKVEKLVVLDCSKACEELGSPKVVNMVLLGAALQTGELPLTKVDILNAMYKKVKPQFHELNEKALEYSQNAGKGASDTFHRIVRK